MKKSIHSIILSTILLLITDQFVQGMEGKITAQPHHMIENTTINDYITTLQERYPTASTKVLKKFADKVLIAKSGTSNLTSKMTPQDVKNYTPANANDPGFIIFDQSLSSHDLTNPNNATPKSIILSKVSFETGNQASNDQITSPVEEQANTTEAVSTKPVITESEQGVTITDKFGDMRQLQFDPLNKVYYYLDNKNQKIFLDTTLSVPEATHTKIIDSQKIQNIDLQNLFTFNQITSIKSTLTDLWRNSKTPTIQDIKTALDTIWKKLESGFQINIANPLKQIIFKESVDSLPKTPDKKEVDSWATSMHKKIIRISLNSINKIWANRAQSFEKSQKKSVSEMDFKNQKYYKQF